MALPHHPHVQNSVGFSRIPSASGAVGWGRDVLLPSHSRVELVGAAPPPWWSPSHFQGLPTAPGVEVRGEGAQLGLCSSLGCSGMLRDLSPLCCHPQPLSDSWPCPQGQFPTEDTELGFQGDFHQPYTHPRVSIPGMSSRSRSSPSQGVGTRVPLSPCLCQETSDPKVSVVHRNCDAEK